uniref:Uncharacterized protein n=1 Tax=Anguilla anguilla TaxID=7936 RepID=A0A0E9XFJ9_ANGAN
MHSVMVCNDDVVIFLSTGHSGQNFG